MANIETPADMKAFYEKFTALARYQDDSKIFDDLLTFIIDLFSFDNPWKPEGRYDDPEIRMRFFDEYSYEEIAVKLSLPLGTVKTQIHRARERMCRLIVENDNR